VSPIDTYRVSVPGCGSVLVSGTSPEAARREAVRHFAETFGAIVPEDLVRDQAEIDFADLPASAGYDYVRRTSGKDIEAGQRVRLQAENGDEAEGWVIYPGRGTAYVHVWLDGADRPQRVDPGLVEVVHVPEFQM